MKFEESELFRLIAQHFFQKTADDPDGRDMHYEDAKDMIKQLVTLSYGGSHLDPEPLLKIIGEVLDKAQDAGEFIDKIIDPEGHEVFNEILRKADKAVDKIFGPKDPTD